MLVTDEILERITKEVCRKRATVDENIYKDKKPSNEITLDIELYEGKFIQVTYSIDTINKWYADARKKVLGDE